MQITMLSTASGKGHMARIPLGCSLEAMSNPQTIASKKMDTLVLQSPEIEFFQQPVSLEEDLKPQMRSWLYPTPISSSEILNSEPS